MTKAPITGILMMLLATTAAACSPRVDSGKSQTPDTSLSTSADTDGTVGEHESGQSATSATTTPTSKPTRKPPQGSRLIRWLQNFTPTGGGGGTHEAAYINFMQGDCSATLELSRTTGNGQDVLLRPLEEPVRSVYEGAAAACLAALHGRADLWQTANKRLARVDGTGLDCWDRSVYLILKALVDAHRADPQARFARGKGGVADCPELKRLSPDHGPSAGGYQVEVQGRNLPMTLDLLWNRDQTVTGRRERPGSPMMLTVPPASAEDPDINIKIATAPRIEPVYAGFHYDEPHSS